MLFHFLLGQSFCHHNILEFFYIFAAIFTPLQATSPVAWKGTSSLGNWASEELWQH